MRNKGINLIKIKQDVLFPTTRQNASIRSQPLTLNSAYLYPNASYYFKKIVH